MTARDCTLETMKFSWYFPHRKSWKRKKIYFQLDKSVSAIENLMQTKMEWIFWEHFKKRRINEKFIAKCDDVNVLLKKEIDSIVYKRTKWWSKPIITYLNIKFYHTVIGSNSFQFSRWCAVYSHIRARCSKQKFPKKLNG